MVRIHPDPPFRSQKSEVRGAGVSGGRASGRGQGFRGTRGRSSVGRAPALQAGGRRFDPVRLHQDGRLEGDLIPDTRCGTCRLRDAAAFDRGPSDEGPGSKCCTLFNNSEGKAFMDLMRVRGCLG